MHLADCFTEIMAYVKLNRENEFAAVDYDVFRNDVQSLIALTRSYKDQHSFNSEDFVDAEFAVFAWIDETVMTSSWQEKERWKTEKLQHTYFNTSDAGRIFFDKLDAIPATKPELVGVYFMCLQAGFKGQYYSNKQHWMLDKVKHNCMSSLLSRQEMEQSFTKIELFPKALPKRVKKSTPMAKRKPLGNYFVWLVPLVPIATVYAVFFLVINYIVASFLDKMH